MDSALLDRLRKLPTLGRDTLIAQTTPCKICGEKAEPFDAVDLNKFASVRDYYGFGFCNISVLYYKCGVCGFLFTTFFDSWSLDQFSEFIYNNDYIKVDPEYAGIRPKHMAAHMRRVLTGSEHVRILDFGSGQGEFATNLLSFGFRNIESYDPFSNPRRPEGQFDVVTCFEVLEHSTSPLDTLDEMRSLVKNEGVIIFTQCIQPPDIQAIRGSWWYLAPRNGHISTFTEHTLAIIAQRSGQLFHAGQGVYAYRGPRSSDEAMTVAARVGLPMVSLKLMAPSSEDTREWYDPEGETKRFRWTRSQRITWNATLPPGRPLQVRIELPFLMSIKRDFPKSCTLSVGDKLLKCSIEGNSITAETLIKTDEPVEVVLDLPPLISPFELRNEPDKRKLGLAVPITGVPL